MNLLRLLPGRLAVYCSAFTLALGLAATAAQARVQQGDNVHSDTAFTQADLDASANQVKGYGHQHWRVNVAPYDQQEGAATRMTRAISAAKKHTRTLIIVARTGTGSSDTKRVDDAVAFFVANKATLQANTGVIVNICNEWGPTTSGVAHPTWRDTYTKAVKTLRQAGITNPIMIDADGYGQNPESIVTYGNGIRTLRWTHNGKSYTAGKIIFSIHLYNAYFQYAYANARNLNVSGKYHVANTLNRMKDATGAEIAVGEWGDNTYGIFFDFNDIRRDCKAQGINIICNWYQGSK